MLLNKPMEMSLSATFKAKASTDDQEGAPLIIKGFANTTTKDRAGDVIPKTAWEGEKAMPNYLKNPIILAFHNHSMPIGKMIGYNISDTGLEIECEISKAAGNIYQLIKDGVLKTFSVGFRCLEADWDEETDIFIIKELELHEVSVVSVPCNQDSVFSVSKSLNGTDYTAFKKEFSINKSSNKTDLDPLTQLAKMLDII